MHDIDFFAPGRAFTTGSNNCRNTLLISDTALPGSALFLLVVLILAPITVSTGMSPLLTLLAPVLGLGYHFGMRKMIKSHWTYGANKDKVDLIKKIDSLPGEYRARFGTDYRTRIFKTYDTRELRQTVNSLIDHHNHFMAERAAVDNDISDLVQAAVESAREVKGMRKSFREAVAEVESRR